MGSPYVFISYSSSDRDRVESLTQVLRSNGVEVWFDQRDIHGGTIWSSEIVDGIRECAAVVLASSPRSMASRNVQQEIQLAWENNRPILPLVLESTSLPPQIEYALAGRQWIDITDSAEEVWLQKALRALHGFGLPVQLTHYLHTGPNESIPTSAAEVPTLIPTNLLYPTTEIIGREQEIEEVQALLGSARVITLTGPGGTGKTRLSLEVGRRMLQGFSDGVFDVQLASVTDPSLAASAIARSLDVREIQGQPLLSSIKSFIYKRSLLLILDNFEHILPARAVVAELLQSCPNLTVLVTSRVRLGIAGEKEYAVEPLTVPSSGDTMSVEACMNSPAVQLFIERAREIRHDFQLTYENAGYVVGICIQLDGLPLAIELAAARTKVLSLQSIRTKLESLMKISTGASANRPERHQTLRNAIAWSFDLLNRQEKSAFPMLGTFVGGFSMAVAESLLGDLDPGLDVYSLVSSLTDKSLLKSDIASNGEIRFRMLETIRDFAREELLAAEKSDTVHKAHARVFAELAESAEPDLRAGRRRTWDPVLQIEQDNIRAALRWSIDHNESELGIRIVGALTYWYFRSSYAEGQQWTQELLERIPQDVDPVLHIKLLRTAGLIAWGMSDIPEMMKYLSEATALVQELDDSRLRCEMLTWAILCNLMDVEQARGVFTKALELTFVMNEKWLRSICYLLMGMVEGIAGDIAAMAQRMEESIEVSRSIGDEWILGGALMFQGALKAAAGELDTAREILDEALSLFVATSDRKNMIATTSIQAGIARCQNNYTAAADLHVNGLKMCREIGELGGAQAHLSGAALLLVARNDCYSATVLGSAAGELQRRTGATPQPFSDLLCRDAPAVIDQQRDALGQESFDQAARHGTALGLEDAIEYACSVLVRSPVQVSV